MQYFRLKMCIQVELVQVQHEGWLVCNDKWLHLGSGVVMVMCAVGNCQVEGLGW